MDAEIADIRAFNRFYTRQIGVLDEHLNRSAYNTAESQVLYEAGARGTTTAAELSRLMRVDPGYLSRVVGKLADLGLVTLAPNPRDRRQNALSLSERGTEVLGELSAGSNAAVEQLLAPLDPAQRGALLAAMHTIEALLGDVERGPIVLRPQRLGEFGWLIHRQGLLYNQQFGWNGDFEALIARIYNDYYFAPEAPPKALWVAEQNGRIAGSIFAMPTDNLPGSAQLRMLYVEPAARGQGIGKMLVDQCVAFARDAGYERMRLWTHTIQTAARKLYEAAGFEVVESEPHHRFGKDLVSEIWELRF